MSSDRAQLIERLQKKHAEPYSVCPYTRSGCESEDGILISGAERDALLAAFGAEAEPPWQPMETCPRGRIVLMFGVTDRHDDGRVANWKKATGSLDFTNGELTWDGSRVDKPYMHRPTHWMYLPPSPPPSVRERENE